MTETQRESTETHEPLDVDPGELKNLLEFIRVKSPELIIRHTQMARSFFVFLISTAILFFLIVDGVGALSIDLTSTKLNDLFEIDNPRPFVIMGVTVACMYYFLRFGYLYYQGTKETQSIHNVIGRIIPSHATEPRYIHDVREALAQECKSNYIIQTVLVFLYPNERNGNGSNFGPLSGSSNGRAWLVKFLMLVIIIFGAILIGLSQVLMLMVFLSFANFVLGIGVVLSFAAYYYFYGELIRTAWLEREGWRSDLPLFFLTIVSIVAILFSIAANGLLLVKSFKAPDVFACRVSADKLWQLSPPAYIYSSFLFRTDDGASQPSTEAAAPNVSNTSGSRRIARVPACKT